MTSKSVLPVVSMWCLNSSQYFISIISNILLVLVNCVVDVFPQWDPMITTLPGLYLLSVGVIKPVMWLVGWTGAVMCSTAMLRFINVLFNCGNLYILYLLICKIHPKDKVSVFTIILSVLLFIMRV